MKGRDSIAVVTATYNRKELLPRLYKSLTEQSMQDFSWIIVDDGSKDGTKEYVQSIEHANIQIEYLQIDNGGKCRALNRVFETYTEFELYVIVDSDDCLQPQALEKIKNTMVKYQRDRNIGGIFFRYINKETQHIISAKKDYSGDTVIVSRLEHDETYGKYDGCIAYYNRAIKKYSYPEFQNENYIGPIVLQLLMEPEFKIVFTKIIVGIAEYQQDGLSRTGRILRLRNPLGMICYCGFLQQSSRIWVRIKYAMLAQAYRIFQHISPEELQKANIPKATFPRYALLGGYVLAAYWKYKYKLLK
ncbi:MAG: glycosyltransferase family 2 protein [Lachnospiraceae bacterium]|jgi:glycosyltransferase involved in cell wall biosynthesis|nr:glycosyltransferase family 2 protein [Lachnospiraceae bacterium]